MLERFFWFLLQIHFYFSLKAHVGIDMILNILSALSLAEKYICSFLNRSNISFHSHTLKVKNSNATFRTNAYWHTLMS